MADGHDATELAMAAFLAGREAECIEILTLEHNRHTAAGHAVPAARMAFWIAFSLIGMGEPARSSGWTARARRLLDDTTADCVERGYVLLPQALASVAAGDLPSAATLFADADRIACRFNDRDLSSLARQGQGRALIALGRRAEGIALFDEVMVAATGGELKPFVAGVVYCSVISACFDLCDLRRAQEWTEALNGWCLAQPNLVLYRGECQAHRAEILRLHGRWGDALTAAQRAHDSLAPNRRVARGAAVYEMAEVYRLRGQTAEAEAEYQRASDYGRSPHPGLALLRLAQGHHEAARAAITRALAEPARGRQRYEMRTAAIDIFIAVGDVPSARQMLEDLESLTAPGDLPLLRGMTAQARATVCLAEGDAGRALAAARTALAVWRELEAPYEAARATALIAQICRSLGDSDGAQMELNAAVRIFQELGATPDLRRLANTPAHTLSAPGRLTDREIEVLKLVASGESNRAIADHLAISEKTVARHLSNIFTKLDLTSRAAATAYAFKNHLVR